MSACYLAVAGHVIPYATRQRVRVRSVVFQLRERLPPLQRVRLPVLGKLLSRFFHANETGLFETTAETNDRLKKKNNK